MPNLNINQFAQVPVTGEQDLQVAKSGILSVVVSANQATALKAGQFVKIDSAATGNLLPAVVAAADNEAALGAVVLDVKQSQFSAGDRVQIALAGVVLWLNSKGTIAPGAQVEQVVASFQVQTKASNNLRGIALDPGTDGNPIRVLIGNWTA